MDNLDIQNCKTLRQEIFKVGYHGGMAHLAPAFSCVEILYTLFNKKVMNYNKSNYKSIDRDRFILSKGHAGLTLYANLVMLGIMDKKTFYSYLMQGSSIGGEPCTRDLDYIEATTGALGHGLSMAVGMALALKKENINAKIYILLGDGECEEGSNWEALMSASKYKLDNLICILDHNKIQKMDTIENSLGFDNFDEKFKSFGLEVISANGHNIDELEKSINELQNNGKPKMIIADTIKGKGVSIMENNPIWHFKEPNKKELKIFLEELELTEEDLINE